MGLICSFSGGKDSTWMVHRLLDNGEQIDAVLTFDTGWEFPEMYEHWKFFEQKTGLEIVVLRPQVSFDYWLTRMPIRAAKDQPEEGIRKGDVHRLGYGWPSMWFRWCTEMKIRALDGFNRRHFQSSTKCIGYAADEQRRITRHQKAVKDSRQAFRYPLAEEGITEDQALQACLEAGYHWNGLYDGMKRVSCFCCPLQPLSDLRFIYRTRPACWQRMLDLEDQFRSPNRGFRGYQSVHDLNWEFQSGQEDDMVEMDEIPVEPR